MEAVDVVAQMRALGVAVCVEGERVAVQPARLVPAALKACFTECREEIVELLKRETKPAIEDRIVSELGGRQVGMSQVSAPGVAESSVLPPIWDGLTEAEKQAEMRAWCKRNGVSYPEGLERLREAEIDRLAMADGWDGKAVIRR